jgi:hypothetical protein
LPHRPARTVAASSSPWPALAGLVLAAAPALAFDSVLQAEMPATGLAAGDNFGIATAVDGDWCVVGAWLDDAAGLDSGSAFVYRRTGTGWTLVQQLLASDLAAGDQFGCAVAIQGDTLVVGAHMEDHGPVNVGAAYVFVRSGGTWTQQAKVIPSDGHNHDHFGNAVDVDGDTVVVGCWEDDAPLSASGSAFVYVRNGTTWTQQQKLLTHDLETGDRLAKSVAISGETILLGCYLDDDLGQTSGSAYFFTRSGTTWTEAQKVHAFDGVAWDDFGIAVALEGDTAVVGSYRDDDLGEGSGSAYVFRRQDGVFAHQTKLVAPDGAPNHDFGRAVAIGGGRIAVGAPQGFWVAGVGPGRVYTYLPQGAGWAFETRLDPPGGAPEYINTSAVVVSP